MCDVICNTRYFKIIQHGTISLLYSKNGRKKEKNEKKINDNNKNKNRFWNKERKKMKQNYTAHVYYMQDYL